MVCRGCNKNIPDDSVFCPYCHHKTEDAAGRRYLDEGKWRAARAHFDFELSQRETAEAHIGRMLADFKLQELEQVVTRPERLLKNKDFAAALALSGGAYREKLEKYASFAGEKQAERKRRRRKRLIAAAVTAAAAAVLSSAAFFAVIPGIRYLYYEKLISDGKCEKAVASYSGSDLFEFDGAVRKLFYDKGKELAGKGGFEKAGPLFDALEDSYKDSRQYYYYCHAKVLWADEDLEAYDYFIACGDFLDAEEILSNEESFAALTSIQGNWKRTGKVKLNTRKNEDKNDDRVILGKASEATLNEMSPYRNNSLFTVKKARLNADKIIRIDKSELIISDSQSRQWHIKISGGKLLFQDTKLNYIYEYTKVG